MKRLLLAALIGGLAGGLLVVFLSRGHWSGGVQPHGKLAPAKDEWASTDDHAPSRIVVDPSQVSPVPPTNDGSVPDGVQPQENHAAPDDWITVPNPPTSERQTQPLARSFLLGMAVGLLASLGIVALVAGDIRR